MSTNQGHKLSPRTTLSGVAAEMAKPVVAESAKDGGDTLALIHVNKVLGWSDRLIMQDGGSAEVDLASLTDSEIAERISQLQRMPAVARATKTKPPRSVH